MHGFICFECSQVQRLHTYVPRFGANSCDGPGELRLLQFLPRIDNSYDTKYVFAKPVLNVEIEQSPRTASGLRERSKASPCQFSEIA